MKILISIHYFPPHIGGMEELSKKQTESLSQLGNDVTVFTCRHNKQLSLYEKSSDGYTLHRLRALNIIENKLGMAYPLISPLQFFKFLKQVGDYDAIHVHDVFYPLSHAVGLAAILRKKPLYMTQHVAIVDHPSSTVKLIQLLMFKTIGKFLLGRARSIVVYNVNVKNFLVALGVDESKIVLNHNGIDTKKFSPMQTTEKEKFKKKYNLQTTKPIVIFVGRLIPEKGYDLLFDSNSDKWMTLIVGNGVVPRYMRNNKNVTFFGPATQNQLVDLYRLSDLFVIPAAVEMFPLTMQEAMACGLPVITYDNKNYAHYKLDRELLKFVERSSHEIKQVIAKLLEDSDLRERMGKYSRQQAMERFSWQKNYQNEFKIYGKILGTPTIHILATETRGSEL